jgi:hypothetical protein
VCEAMQGGIARAVSDIMCANAAARVTAAEGCVWPAGAVCCERRGEALSKQVGHVVARKLKLCAV